MKGTELAGGICGFANRGPRRTSYKWSAVIFNRAVPAAPITPQYAAWIVVLYQPSARNSKHEFHLRPHAADAAVGIIPIEKARRLRLVLDRDQMRRLRKEGKSLREISDAMGLSLTTTARILKTA